MSGMSVSSSAKPGPALIIGCTGQDGYYLSKSLASDEVDCIGVSRSGVSFPGRSVVDPLNILDAVAISKLIADCRPSEIYYLAAHHRSSEDPPETVSESLGKSYDTHVQGLVNVLDGIRDEFSESRLFYAASSHVFGNPPSSPQNEETPFLPINVYGITKAAGVQLCRLYRRTHGIHCSAGILYNHESPRRSPSFVGRKIVRAAVAIKEKKRDKLILGDLSAEIDWGAAVDYVEAMRAILRLEVPDDFVIASGELHSIGAFVEIVFDRLNLNSKDHVEIKPGLITKPSQAQRLVGDARKLREATGWQPKMSFEQVIHSMVDAELAGKAV